ncbi:AhpC/TSA family protein [Marinilabiliaceae bacterium JC017]|nr:AhpC/TSA family protein [Marinilabiliaceae bacterium JC017]
MTKIAILSVIISLFMWPLVAQNGLQVGDKAPDFSGKDKDGNNVMLSEALKKGPVVLFFYRGQWCPYCNRHMSDVQDSLVLIQASGASVIAVTPEKSEAIETTIEKTHASFSVVHDQGHVIMDSYEVSYVLGLIKHSAYKVAGIDINKASGNEDRVLPVPATFIIDASGVITERHFDPDYKNRMTVKAILEALEKL